jgi:sugar phosphate isomerase/epimerase
MAFKYAFMSFSCPELTFSEMLQTANDLGYAAVEPRSESGHKHGVELDADAGARKEIRDKAAAGGIDICCVATSCRYADPDTAEQHVEDTLKYIDLAADIGSPRLRVFGGKIGDGLDRAAAVDLVSKSLRACAEHAEKRNVTICVETHDDWCDPMHLAAVMQKVGQASIAVNWDIMHPVRAAGYNMDDAYEAIAPWIRHVHVHDGALADGKLEFLPIGEGIIDHRRAMEILKEVGYDGYLSGEWIGWEPHEIHLPREIGRMKESERLID